MKRSFTARFGRFLIAMVTLADVIWESAVELSAEEPAPVESKEPSTKDSSEEEAAYAEAMKWLRQDNHDYSTAEKRATLCGAFVTDYPKSAHHREMAQQAFFANFLLVNYLSFSSPLRQQSLKIPTGLDYEKLRNNYQRRGLHFIAEYNRRYPNKKYTGGGTSIDYREEILKLANFGGTETEMEEAIATYGETYDERPDFVPHSDFLRLDYYAKLKDKERYLKLLGEIQQRWPDVNDLHWQSTAAETLVQLCDLIETDPRGTHFYWWLRGKRPAGELP